MSRTDSTIFVQLRALRRDLSEKQGRIREELAALGHDLKRLPPQKRRGFVDYGLALRLIEDLEAQIYAGASDDVPGMISHLVGVLKQLQTAALPGNATPLHGSPITEPGPSSSGVRPVGKSR
jgi:hypothetical protein